MNTLRFVVVLIFVFAAFHSCERANAETVLDVLKTNFTSFYRSIEPYPALVSVLNDTKQNLTVFVPSNQAVNNTKNITQQLLQYHISPEGQLISSNLTNQRTIITLFNSSSLNNESQVLIVSQIGNQTQINGANIIGSISGAENGIVQEINSVLFPPSQSVYETVSSSYSNTQALLIRTKNQLDMNALTFFLPNNQAYNNSNTAAVLSYLLLNESMSQNDANNIIQYHIVSGVKYSYNLLPSDTLTANNSESINITKPNNWPNSSIVVNGAAQFVGPDILAANGVVHVINQLLIPPTFNFTTEKLLLGLGAFGFLTQVNHSPNNVTILNAGTLFVPKNWVNTTDSVLLYHCVAEHLNTSIPNQLVSSLLQLNSLGGGYQQLKLTTGLNNQTLVNGQNITYGGMSSGGTIVYLIENVLQLPPPVAVLLGSDNFTTLAAAVNAVALSGNLTTDSLLAVFAPTQEAFGLLPNGTVGYLMLNNSQSSDSLRMIVENHVLKYGPPVLYSYEIKNGTSYYQTWGSNNITVNKTTTAMGEVITVNDASVVLPDLIAGNGVVHGIDRVLIPASVRFNIVNLLEGLGTYSQLLTYLNTTGLLLNLTSPGPYTIFAPDDEAWLKVADLNALEGNETMLHRILLTHLVGENITQLTVNHSIIVESNQTIKVNPNNPNEIELLDSSGESIGTATVITSSYGYNGYIYGIDTVLGVPQESSSGGGLQTWEIALIVVGGVIVGLLLLGLVVAIVYFVFLKPRTGYRKIN